MAKKQSRREREPTAGSLLGEWLRRTRKEHGLSQRALADRSGLSRSYVCDIERGRGSEPSLATLDKLAGALGASRADLMRAAGLIDRTAVSRESDEERRLLAVFRNLSESGQLTMLRFARFLHQEEQAWTQASFVDGPESDEEPAPRQQQGPTLFDMGD